MALMSGWSGQATIAGVRQSPGKRNHYFITPRVMVNRGTPRRPPDEAMSEVWDARSHGSVATYATDTATVVML
jgi:hypothetical protein